MARNQFEQVDKIQPDAITLSLMEEDGAEKGVVILPAAASGGRLKSDHTSERLGAVESFRSAIRLANEMKVAIVVMDPDGIWKAEWGDLYRDTGAPDEPAAS